MDDIKEATEIGIWKFITMLPSLLNDPLPALTKMSRKYGDVIHFKLGKKQQLYFINNPDMIQHILKTNQDNYSRRKAIKPLFPLLGDGIFMSEGELWQKHHAMMRPAFHEEQVRKYYHIIKEETNTLIQDWLKCEKQNKPVFPERDIQLLMLRILFRTQFSASEAFDWSEILFHFNKVLDESGFRHQKLKYAKNKILRTLKLNVGRSEERSTSLIYLDNVADSVLSSGEKNPESAGSLLKILTDALENRELSRKQAKDELLNILFAGFDTTAAGITWTLACLAGNQSVQHKLRNEISAEDAGWNNLERYNRLEYSRMVIMETMRLYPPVWAFHRVSEKEDIVEGYRIPAGFFVMLCPYTLHRHKDHWEKPDEFYPEHFSKENFKGKAFTYIPFGQGKRICIGKPMAMSEIQMILPLLVERFHFSTTAKKLPGINPGIIIKAASPLKLGVKSVIGS